MEEWIAILALGVVPIFFLPVTQDFYDINKLMLLVIAACALLLFRAVRIIRSKHITLTVSPQGIAYGALLIASLTGVVFASTNKVDALMMPLGPVAMASLLVVTLFLRRSKALEYLFIGSAAVLGLIALYQFVGMGSVMFPTVPFLQDPLWTPTGSTTTTIMIFAVAVAWLVPRVKKTPTFAITSLLCIVSGVGVTVWQFIPRIPTAVIPLPAALAVAIHAARTLKGALVGVGVENFVSAYTMGKPLSLTTTPLWNVRFGVNADFFLHEMTIYGLTGLAAAIIFAWQAVKRKSAASWVCFVGLFIVPPTLTLLTLGAIVIVLSGSGSHIATKPIRPWLRMVLAGVCLLAAAFGLYATGRAYLAETEYFKALTAAQKNKGTDTYNLHALAISNNPFVTRYHMTFSQVNLSLANSVAAGAKNDQSRQAASQLIQQSIAQAKVAVTLSPESITAWENLGSVYQALMNVAQGGDTWAAASYQKAISFDPTNPVLALNLGIVLVHEKKYDDAVTAFNRAITLRPDFANAYYNLANGYLLKGDFIDAKAALTKTMTLVQAGSADWDKANNLMESLSRGEAPATSQ